MAQTENGWENEYEYDIIGGPGKFDLAFGFFRREALGFRIKKRFAPFTNEYVYCVLDGINFEDASGDSFMVNGRVISSGESKESQNEISYVKEDHAQEVTIVAHFDFRTGKGSMKITVKATYMKK